MASSLAILKRRNNDMRKRIPASLDNIAKAYCKICPYCNRRVPNHEFFTRTSHKWYKSWAIVDWCNGCRWCDNDYHRIKK